MKLDIKSALIGAALALVVGAALGAGVVQRTESGRFQITTSEGHALVLDTVTGQVWEKFEPTSSGETSDGFMDSKLGPRKSQ